MEKKEIVELVKYRNSLLEELQGEMNVINAAEQDSLHTTGREIHIQRMKDIRKTLKEIETYFRTLGTFNTKEFTKFMTKFFTLTDGEVYTRTIKKASNPKGSLGSDSYYIVHGKSTQELVDELTETDDDLRHFVHDTERPFATVVKGETVFPFKSNATMLGEFGKHYRLKYAIYELMQLKADDPEISDQQRYSTVLDNTRKRNETIYNGEHK